LPQGPCVAAAVDSPACGRAGSLSQPVTPTCRGPPESPDRRGPTAWRQAPALLRTPAGPPGSASPVCRCLGLPHSACRQAPRCESSSRSLSDFPRLHRRVAQQLGVRREVRQQRARGRERVPCGGAAGGLGGEVDVLVLRRATEPTRVSEHEGSGSAHGKREAEGGWGWTEEGDG
jgi:hypothetical protein